MFATGEKAGRGKVSQPQSAFTPPTVARNSSGHLFFLLPSFYLLGDAGYSFNRSVGGSIYWGSYRISASLKKEAESLLSPNHGAETRDGNRRERTGATGRK